MDSDGAHQAADSRPPVNLNAIRPGATHATDLHGRWRDRFARYWDRPDRLFYVVLLAEEDLAASHHPGKRGVLEATEGTILAFRGSVSEAAARFGVNMEYVETLRRRNRLDPESGVPWLWPSREEVARLPAVAIERRKGHALEVARGMLAEGLSQRRVSEATGIPRGTLQRSLGVGDG